VREIKFRGKRIDNGEWVYGGYYKHFNGQIGILSGDVSPVHAAIMDEVDPSTVGQYTGLHDKNGKEVYEGDIIRWDEKEWGETYNEIVTWDYELFAIRKSDWKEYCEVAGNIYGNPELSQKQ